MAMQLNNKGLLFSHIPKTAGTSFRRSVERFAKGWKVYSDYEESNPTTSRIIRSLYKSGDYSKIGEINGKQTLLAGHFPIIKYLPYYPIHRVITFVRDPVQRVISHYHDLQRRIGYSESLEKYISEKRYQNQQVKFIKDIPIEAIGFIGVCDYYDESIEMLKLLYGIDVPIKKLNTNKEKKDEYYQASEEIIQNIKEVNDKDFEFYNKAIQIFELRRELLKKNEPYVYGKITSIDEEQIKGWAINPNINKPVELNVINDDEILSRMIANVPVPELEDLNYSGIPSIGFNYRGSDGKPIRYRDDSDIKIQVKTTGQILSK